MDCVPAAAGARRERTFGEDEAANAATSDENAKWSHRVHVGGDYRAELAGGGTACDAAADLQRACVRS